MNKQGAQVFIATTNGLVQVQSISRLSNPNLQSVATIGNTSQLAGISRSYQDYVEKPQGLINDLFNNKAYRLHLSNGIDQGESWQLGVFIAHYLFEYDCLSSGASLHSNVAYEPDSNISIKDIIFIATGKVDTLHYHVLPIDELAKKCRHANAHIADWQSLGHKVCYLAPTHNVRQGMLDTVIKLTPIANLRELFHLCGLFGLSTQDLHFPDSVHSVQSSQKTESLTAYSNQQKDIVDASFIDEEPSVAANYIEDEQGDTHLSRSYFSRLWFVLLSLIALIILWLIVTRADSLSKVNEIQSTGQQSDIHASVDYIIAGDISQNRAMCSSATRVLINRGKFAVDTQSNATNLNNLCNIFVTTSVEVNSLWLVSDTKAIIRLKGINIDAQTLAEDSLPSIKDLLQRQEALIQWAIPIPNNKEQTRRFILLAFLHLADDADFSALDSYLFQLHQQGKDHNMADLQKWIDKTQRGQQVLMFEQELSIYQ